MKHIYKSCIALIIFSFAAIDMLYAQQEVMVRDLHEYDFELQSQADLPDHPLAGVEVTFDAVIVSYPKNSGLASIVDATGEPGRIHVFVTDVNAITEGEDGMSIQIVVEGAQRTTLEGLFRGDVIRVTGDLGFFGNVSQFDASDVELLGSISDGYENLEPLLEPTVMSLTDLNRETEQEGVHEWRADNYTANINRYVKFEGLEVIDRLIADNGRPWFILSDGNTILTSNDTSLRFRNDRGLGYAYDPVADEGLGYNWRRLDESLDGPFQPPAPGSIVDISGFVVVNTFDPGSFDESTAQSTLKIAPWDDGVVWQNDGVDPSDRLTPADWPNDLVVQGFPPILTDFEINPTGQILNDAQVTASLDVLLPEENYTLESVQIQYMIYPYTEDEGTLVTEDMTAVGDTYSHTFSEQADFTTVDFEIIATASTPDGVTTRARESGSYSVESATQTSPVVMTPAAGTYINQVSVELSSVTEGASIYYTTNGDDPDATSTQYSSAINVEETTTIKAIAIADGLNNSPITTRTYSIDVEITEVSTLVELSSGLQDGTTYQYTGDAVVTYARNSRNQKYLMDPSGGILIDDSNGTITSDYTVGDVMTDVIGTLSAFNGVVQFIPSADPGDPQSTADVVPLSVTLADLNYDEHESMLVEIEDVSFEESGVFESGENYNLVDGSLAMEETVTFRTNFSESDYIGQEIPSGVINLTALVGGFNGNLQLIARSSADFGPPTSNENDINPYTFDLSQNYPNPFNPSTQINYSLAQTADVQLVVYDILGRQVANLVNSIQSAGTYSVNFDMSQFSSGTYIYRLEAGDFVSVRKMMLIK